jgi:acetyl esterase/lipase
MEVTPFTYTYKTVGDCRINADIYPHPDGAAHAALVFIHGGCLIGGSRKDLNRRQLDLYLSSGYSVISIDYRLAPETKLPGIIDDLVDAFQWITNPGPELASIDPQRIGVIGHSAGGYLALMSGCCVVPRPKAIVSFYGYGDIIGDWYSKPDSFYCQHPMVSEEESGRHVIGPVISEHYEGRGKEQFYLYCRQNGLWPLEVGGHDPIDEASFFTPYCSIQNIADDYPPTLLLHGDDDTDVPYEQSVDMDRKLTEHGLIHDFITMPGRGHGFDGNMDDPIVKSAFDKVLAFLDMHVKNGQP